VKFEDSLKLYQKAETQEGHEQMPGSEFSKSSKDKGMAFKVSALCESLIVPPSLTTYTYRSVNKGLTQT
jgi:hypothetical protein